MHLQEKGDNMSRIRVGVISPNDERPWVREASDKTILGYQQMLVDALEAEGVEVIEGKEGLAEADQVVWDTRIVKKQICRIVDADVDALIISMGDWTWPCDSRDAVQLLGEYMRGLEHDIARVLFFCYKAPEAPGLVSGMAAGGALRRIGIPYKLVFGKIDKDPEVTREIMEILEMFHRRKEVAQVAQDAVNKLKGEKYLSLGGSCMKMATGTADFDQWSKVFGITYDCLDQSELTRRAQPMADWEGKPGHSKLIKINDPRVEEALEYQKAHATFDLSRASLSSYDKFIYQLTYYYAAIDLVEEQECQFMGIKCQDELSGHECTQCVAAAFLNNNTGPEGKAKYTTPVACENDMDSSLTQLILKHLNNEQPAGFGDFRDIEDNILAVVNCGQHPPYFFGTPDETDEEKLSRIEYMGQEHYYRAGGATVKGRTPGGQVMTFARLHRENLRYGLVGMVVTTIQPNVEDHKKYSESWPIIYGKTPISDREVIDLWPCNHLGFTYGDLSAELIEFAERVGIGYTVVDAKGNVYKKLT